MRHPNKRFSGAKLTKMRDGMLLVKTRGLQLLEAVNVAKARLAFAGANVPKRDVVT